MVLHLAATMASTAGAGLAEGHGQRGGPEQPQGDVGGVVRRGDERAVGGLEEAALQHVQRAEQPVSGRRRVGVRGGGCWGAVTWV